MMQLDRVSVAFGAAVALREASLQIEPGMRLGIVGESGCGKSMLGLCLMGMIPDAGKVSGSIRLNGKELAGAPEHVWRRHRARDVAMIFQEPMAALNPLKRIGDTVMEPLEVHEGLSRSAARARALALFDEVGIPDPDSRLRQYPHEISGGQRQRVLIALALACNPSLLVADEPTTALDANVALRIIDLLVRLSETRNMALVFISHDLAAVARATQQIAVMYGGDIVERGPTAQVLGAPRHPYTIGLLGARPGLDNRGRGPDGRRKRLVTIPGTVPPLFELPAGCRFSGRCTREIASCALQRPQPLALGAGQVAACHLLGQAHAGAGAS
ncbi:MAG: ABC transporter ATP-binding protein [Pararhodobacter sp.]